MGGRVTAARNRVNRKAFKPMSNKRLVGHKPKRDERNNKELSDLRRENAQLRREVARLSKLLDKQIHIIADREESALADHAKTMPQVKIQTCETCQSPEIKEVKMPTGRLVVCQGCGLKKVFKNG